MSAGIWSDIKVWWKQWRCPHPPWRIVISQEETSSGYLQSGARWAVIKEVRTCFECGKEWKL